MNAARVGGAARARNIADARKKKLADWQKKKKMQHRNSAYKI